MLNLFFQPSAPNVLFCITLFLGPNKVECLAGKGSVRAFTSDKWAVGIPAVLDSDVCDATKP